ncbi:MAG: phosphonopyruvate decarboxylase [Alphaproteobacteria bacterium]|nr:phosphonopyruvate decarboxylase [Alphaproteobacteria bacterium]
MRSFARAVRQAEGAGGASATTAAWPDAVYGVLKDAGIRQASYVPDAGHARLIERLHADAEIQTTVLTTEEEGIALAAGAWLGGQRSVLLMQSSGVGNCVNMLSLLGSCRFPLLTLVTMRGEWAEFNPWQVPMGRATPGVLEAMGVKVARVDQADEVAEAVSAASVLAFDSDQAVAVLLSQRLLGRKKWTGK